MSYKTLICAKPLCASLDKVEWFIRVYDGARYLVLFGREKYYFVYSRFRYLIGVKGGITYVISHIYAKIKVDSYNYLSLEKILTVIILIKSVFNKDENNYYYYIFLGKRFIPVI